MTVSEEINNRAIQIKDEYRGIFPPCGAFYIHSILYPTKSCLECFALYKELVSGKHEIPPEYLMSVIQEAISNAAALSRFFWPAPKNKKSPLGALALARGEKLRLAYCIDENSPLFDRRLRNTWEHFDEKLDEYLLNHSSGVYFPECRIASHELADDPEGHIFKLIDPDHGIIVLLGEKFNFLDIEKEVQRIFTLTEQKDRNGCML